MNDNIRIGAKYSWKPDAFASKCEGDERQKPTVCGRIIYINEEHGHFTAEALFNGYRIRECFRFVPKKKAIVRAR